MGLRSQMEEERGEKRGSIAFFTTYRPPVPLDIYSSPFLPTSSHDELHLTDGTSYNYNAQPLSQRSLKSILSFTQRNNVSEMASLGTAADVDSGRLSGTVFVSERTHDLETLHIAITVVDGDSRMVEVFNFAEVYGTFKGVRMEDSGCIAGDYLVYVTTKDPAMDPRQPWTAVYKTNLVTGYTHRLTPPYQADLSPAAAPSGKKIAVASFQKRGGWHGQRENLKTDIFVMNVDKPFNRTLVIKDGGWPTWGTDHVLFFHRKVADHWGVFRADLTDISNPNICRVTPQGIDAITPAAIDANTVAAATIRQKSQLRKFTDVRQKEQYRHIEIFDFTGLCLRETIAVTEKIRPFSDHFNPFICEDRDGVKRVGYNRCRISLPKDGDDVPRKFDKLQSQHTDIGLFRVSGVFPTFSADGSKVAFVDNNFKAVWVADDKGLRNVFERKDNKIFAPVWSQNPQKDILYVCFGPSFEASETVHICAIPVAAKRKQQYKELTMKYNNAFPSTNPEGTKLVFRSTRDHHGSVGKYKNLYIMENAEVGEYMGGKITRLTEGNWTDTHCKWSPKGEWIVFASNRDRPDDAHRSDEDLDSGYFAVYLVKANDPSVLVRVMSSGTDLAGHVTHPFFSPDGKSIVVTADLAAVSVDPMSLPLFLHSARPYGDIFTINIDPDSIQNNCDVGKFHRITHSRFENATGTWTKFSTDDATAKWNEHINKDIKKQSQTLTDMVPSGEKVLIATGFSAASVALFFLFPYAFAALLLLSVFAALRHADFSKHTKAMTKRLSKQEE